MAQHGNSSDYGYGIALDSSGGVYLTGATFSTDFSTTTVGFGPTPDTDPGTRDAIVAKLKSSTVVTATFVYDGDGNWVMGTVAGVTTAYIGNYAEWRGGRLTKYYYAGGKRVAMREGSQQAQWLLRDLLDSTSTTVSSTGSTLSEMRYKAWGETRYDWGTTSTTFRFTGQRQEPDLGLYYYGARWYDPALGRFIQPDTIVPEPGNPLAFDRFSYTYNNPVRYTDPSGHCVVKARPIVNIDVGADILNCLTKAGIKLPTHPHYDRGRWAGCTRRNRRRSRCC